MKKKNLDSIIDISRCLRYEVCAPNFEINAFREMAKELNSGIQNLALDEQYNDLGMALMVVRQTMEEIDWNYARHNSRHFKDILKAVTPFFNLTGDQLSCVVGSDTATNAIAVKNYLSGASFAAKPKITREMETLNKLISFKDLKSLEMLAKGMIKKHTNSGYKFAAIAVMIYTLNLNLPNWNTVIDKLLSGSKLRSILWNSADLYLSYAPQVNDYYHLIEILMKAGLDHHGKMFAQTQNIHFFNYNRLIEVGAQYPEIYTPEAILRSMACMNDLHTYSANQYAELLKHAPDSAELDFKAGTVNIIFFKVLPDILADTRVASKGVEFSRNLLGNAISTFEAEWKENRQIMSTIAKEMAVEMRKRKSIDERVYLSFPMFRTHVLDSDLSL